MNRTWAIKAEQRLAQVEARTKAQPDVSALLAEIASLQARVSALETKAHVHPGRKAAE
jgi:hypothetical protein